jgi:hypothetical protein
MPNWCFNRITIQGQFNEIKEFVCNENYEFDLDKIIPYPEPFRQMDAEWVHPVPETYRDKWGTDTDGFNKGGYEWRLSNWNTKWNIKEAEWHSCESNDGFVEFDSAWSPPIGCIYHLSLKFPESLISIEYDEPGCQFGGSIVWKNGEEIEVDMREGDDYVPMFPYDSEEDQF